MNLKSEREREREPYFNYDFGECNKQLVFVTKNKKFKDILFYFIQLTLKKNIYMR